LRRSERIGKAGEYYVCFILSQLSDLVCLVPHGSHADIVFEWKDKLYKCQVKTVSKRNRVISKHTGKIYRTNYKFELRRGSHTKNRTYEEDHNDIYALFIIPLKKVIFLPGNLKKQSFRFSRTEAEQISTKDSFLDSVQQRLNEKIIYFKK